MTFLFFQWSRKVYSLSPTSAQRSMGRSGRLRPRSSQADESNRAFMRRLSPDNLLVDLRRIHQRGESKSGVFYNPVMYWTIFTCTRSNWTSSIVPKLTKMTPPWSININHVLFNEKITSRRMKLEMLVTFCSCNEQPFYYIKVKNDVIVKAISKLGLLNQIGEHHVENTYHCNKKFYFVIFIASHSSRWEKYTLRLQ